MNVVQKIRDFNPNLNQRKFKMVGLELILFSFLLGVTNAISVLFPMEETVIRSGDYTLYMLFALLDILLVALMGVVIGWWIASWYFDKIQWKDDPHEP